MRVAAPVLAHLGHVVFELRGALGHVAGARFEVPLLAVDVVVSSAVETARSGFFAFRGFVAIAAVDRRLGLRNLFFHFLVLGVTVLFRQPLEVAVATRGTV